MHFAPGIAVLGAAGILGIGEHTVLVAAQPDRLLQRPRAIRIERDARLGKALRQRRDRLHFRVARQHAALQLEIAEAVARLRRLREAHDRLRRERLLVAQAQPVVVGLRLRLR